MVQEHDGTFPGRDLSLRQLSHDVHGHAGKPTGLTFSCGKLRIVDASGHVVADNLDPTNYSDYIGEKVEPWSYLKSTYYKPKGFPDGVYRVGPLARLNVADRCGTPRADQELAEFHELQPGVVR